MDRGLSVYISASAEMDAECEFIGQTLASVSTTSRATIRRTPEGSNPDLEGLASSQIYIILLGTDLLAPIGVEWEAARQAGLATLGFRNAEAAPSPAMTDFLRRQRFEWHEYRTPAEFRLKLERTLLQRLLDETPGTGLDLTAVEQIAVRLKELEGEEAEDEGPAEERRGAGSGGIILPRP